MTVFTATVRDVNGKVVSTQLDVGVTAPSSWPDSTNTGYLNAPGYPGSLTTWPGGAFVSGQTYKYFDFPNNSGTVVNANNVTFIGCRFQSNNVSDNNIYNSGTGNTYSYCSIVPRITKATAPPNAAWPSAGAGTNVDTLGNNFAPYMIGGNSGYQFGVKMGSGPATLSHCDIWGFGNAVIFYETSTTMIVDSCWIHDAANPTTQGYHTDGPGYLEGQAGCSNITIKNCTIASIGNTNGLAMQAATAYNNIVVTGNYFSGFAYCVDMCHGVGTNLNFSNNTLGTDLRWAYGMLYPNTNRFTTAQPSNQWFNNKLAVRAGGQSSGPGWVAADNGKFIYPNGTLSTIDYVDGHP